MLADAKNSAERKLLEISDAISQWQQAGERIALATVISVQGSAPRAEGAKMVVSESGKIAGSVSGGCVESAVAQEASAVLASGKPTIVRYGINRNMMWDVGLSCGGTIDVFIEPLRRPLSIAPDKVSAICTIVRGPRGIGEKITIDVDGASVGEFSSADLQPRVLDVAGERIASGQSKTVQLGEFEIFVDVNIPDSQVIMVGAVHIAAALCPMAVLAGFSVTVIDPRPALCNRERFPQAKRLIVDWPEDALPKLSIDENTYVAVLTHDEKFDDPTLLRVLPTRARYVGAIGSKKTQAERRKRLLDAGISTEDVEKLHGPIGLDIGAQSPEEIAVAILAEMIAAKYLRSGLPLRNRAQPHIHA